MGEENTPNKDDHQAIIGSMPGTQVVTEYVDVTKYQQADSGSSSITPIIIVVAIVIVIGAIAAILIIKKRDEEKAND